MNRNLLKTLLIAAALCLGAGSLWAAEGDVTTNADIDFSNEISDGAVAGTTNSMALSYSDSYPFSISSGILVVGSGSGTVTIAEDERAGSTDKVTITFDLAFGKLSGKYINFGFYDADGSSLGEFEFCPYSSTLTNDFGVETDDMYYGYNTVIWERCVSFTIVYDYSASTITTSTICYKSGSSKTATTAEHSVGMVGTNPIATFVLSSDYTNSQRFCQFDNLTIKTTEGAKAETASYTIKYVDGDGNSVKDSETRTGVVGNAISLSSSDTSDFTTTDDDGNSVKYIYESDDASSYTISSDGSTVVTVKFHEAATYSYTVYASVDNSVIQSGTTLEGDPVTVIHPKYINQEGTLYEAESQNSGYHYSLDVTSDNQTDIVTYTASDITNVYYFSEGENIDGVSKYTEGNTSIRSSYGAGGCANTTDDDGNIVPTTITTVPAGTYSIVAVYYGNNASSVMYVYAGEETIISASGVTNYTSYTASLTAPEETTISFYTSGNAALDFIYIVSIDEYTKTIPSYLMASFSAPVNVSVPEGVTVYAATACDGSTVTLTEVETDVIPANTGVILAADEAGDITLEATSEESSADFTSNLLVATSSEPTAGAENDGNAYYGLNADNEETTAEFAQITAGTTFSSDKAYLVVEGSSDSSEAKSLKIVFGTTTGISEISSSKAQEAGAFYNLQGVKVQSPTKGLYIQDGKKVILK